jgi:hypothetical protein
MLGRFTSTITAFVISYTACSQDTLYLKQYFRQLRTMDVTINESTYSFLFDTGGGETFISPEIAAKMNKPVYGDCTSFRLSGEEVKYQRADSVTLTLHKTSFFHTTLGVYDVMQILPKELPKVDGIISLKSFLGHVVTFDLANNRMIVQDSLNTRKRSKETLVPSRFANGLSGNEMDVFVGIVKSGYVYWFLFDSGNIRSIIVSEKIGRQWGLNTHSGESKEPIPISNLYFGKHAFDEIASVEPIIYEGVLNYDFIAKRMITIDFVRREVWSN